MNTPLAELANRFLAITQGERLIALSEGLVKIRCIEAALALGWTIQEGTTRPNEADFIREREGQLHWTRGTRVFSIADGSCDVTVVSPFQIGIEIKCRADHGVKAQALFKGIWDDVERVSKIKNMAFLFVFEPKIYLSFSGEKNERRGRKGNSQWFISSFPPRATVASDGIHERVAQLQGVDIELGFARLGSNLKPAGVLVMGYRRDSDFREQSAESH